MNMWRLIILALVLTLFFTDPNHWTTSGNHIVNRLDNWRNALGIPTLVAKQGTQSPPPKASGPRKQLLSLEDEEEIRAQIRAWDQRQQRRLKKVDEREAEAGNF